MELLVLLVAIFGLLAISANIAYRLELSELDLFKRRLAAYEQLKSAVRRVGATGAVSNVDTDRFAHAMSGMRFLFDEDLERFVRGIYDALLKKHALDALLEKAAGQESAPTDQALIDKALRKSQELASQISNGIYGDMPEHMEKFMRRRLVSSPPGSASPEALPSSRYEGQKGNVRQSLGVKASPHPNAPRAPGGSATRRRSRAPGR
jgi:hypothetical protein